MDTLKYNWYYNEDIEFIPNNIKYLEFGYEFNKDIKCKIPNCVVFLKFGWCFNKPLNNIIPNSVKYLTFGNHFNQSIDVNNIPNSVIELTFGGKFNQELINLPNSIIKLVLKYNFNKSLDNIPTSVTHLTLGYNFDHDIHKIPNTIKYLSICDYPLSKINNLFFLDYICFSNYDLYEYYYCIYIKKIKQFYFYTNRSEFEILQNIIYNNNLFKGNDIQKDLVEYVFNPKRLLNICNIFNIELIDYIDII